jgi:magnesium transporter
MPLSFIASVYGMNFDPALSPLSMPELRSPYGYVAVLGLMAAIAIAMLAWFWRRGWLRGDAFVSDPPPR